MRIMEYEIDTTPSFESLYKSQDFAMQLALMVIEWRLLRGISQNELALRMGTTQTRIAFIESGVRPPTLAFLKRVADALEIKFRIEWEADTK